MQFTKTEFNFVDEKGLKTVVRGYNVFDHDLSPLRLNVHWTFKRGYKGWIVSEFYTGRIVGLPYSETRKAAVDRAIAVLKWHGVVETEAAVRDSIRRHGQINI